MLQQVRNVDAKAQRRKLLAEVERIAPVLQASGPKSEEIATLAPEAVAALREAGFFRLKLPAAVGGFEAGYRDAGARSACLP